MTVGKLTGWEEGALLLPALASTGHGAQEEGGGGTVWIFMIEFLAYLRTLMPTQYPYNDPQFKRRRQKLRHIVPQAEKLLWKKLKGSQLNGFKFRRQYGVDYFIVDFYCPKLRLAIELDSDSHDSVVVQHYDRQRQVVIEKKDITFLRFSNDEVYGNLEGVVEMISDTANKLSERQ